MLDEEMINLFLKRFNAGEIPELNFADSNSLQRSCEEIILWSLWRRATKKYRFRREILNFFDKIKIEVVKENGK
jgi:hypothetical protein